jgi:branched-chain amino acid aminotransferase
MITIPWTAISGWDTPRIIPCKNHTLFTLYAVPNCYADGPLVLDPSCTVLHYAQTIFEGMKAYRDENNKVTMFRPDMNMKVATALIACRNLLNRPRPSE